LPALSAIFFDVDFTLIYPGPTFQGEGYQQFAARYGMSLDPARFANAVRAASSILDSAQEHVYDADIFIRYTGRIIEEMGGEGDRVVECASEVYDEWAACQHFFLYDDVAPALQALAAGGYRLGLISNSHRPLDAFKEHFALDGLVSVAISSADHGYMKPHPSIFEAALAEMGVAAEAAVMVGDSISHDIAGAQGVGMRGVLVHRSDEPAVAPPDIPVIRTLSELPALLRG
jgi:HAD superfamily hydrolase (TIGR01662 family)